MRDLSLSTFNVTDPSVPAVFTITTTYAMTPTQAEMHMYLGENIINSSIPIQFSEYNDSLPVTPLFKLYKDVVRLTN